MVMVISDGLDRKILHIEMLWALASTLLSSTSPSDSGDLCVQRIELRLVCAFKSLRIHLEKVLYTPDLKSSSQ